SSGTGGGSGGTGGGTSSTGGGAGATGGGSISGSGGGTGTTGSVGPNGGTVDHLYFAVVGDTRPSTEDDTANYPTAIITKIYQDIEALNPRPQFVVTTGDYQFANPNGTQGVPQLSLYMNARNNYSGTVFATMGNHECTGATAGNCNSATKNYTAFPNALLSPLGQNEPYYTININGPSNAWTSKFIITACNWWSSTQQTWLQQQLAIPTTYTFIVRHMSLISSGPCNSQMDPMVQTATKDGFLAGHT